MDHPGVEMFPLHYLFGDEVSNKQGGSHEFISDKIRQYRKVWLK